MSGIDYCDMTDGDLEQELVGKKIVKIDTENNTMTLHDGTVLKFHDASDCCAWFEAELEEKNLTDNAITHVTTTGEYGDESWSIHILAANNHIADVNITGNEGSGYYCHSIDLEITNPDK
ncbi:hypothetical protein [Corynebacterium lujinxingii]|uniref:DUF7448 domain-containing protein n=1 Tax=Corynebacterium lujinxingii TaxID=2763010 RepID=A0A7H0K0Q6_9CORY|nr:hypothetical protein [Corynebacterium lujinxingii]MBC3179383.1 hypothetical protein [Corynebacterium lujinxingii]NNO11491.1 hypothetical protein [Corynebacterium lujinxingii]QNP90872.1 hypothetical protein IAU68_03655 [Corynebacterium lujinxingii]